MKPDEDCPVCDGTGVVVDWVPYGDTNVPMYSACDCCCDDEEEEYGRPEVDSAL